MNRTFSCFFTKMIHGWERCRNALGALSQSQMKTTVKSSMRSTCRDRVFESPPYGVPENRVRSVNSHLVRRASENTVKT